MKLSFLLAAGLLAVLPLRADDPQQVARIENAMADALGKNDAAAFRALISDDWKIVLSDGSIVSADQIVKTLKEGKLKFSAVSVEDLEVRLYGDTAIVIGVGRSKGEFEGQDFSDRDRFTDVFIRTDGKWRCVSSHSSDLANR
jgi:ketosteroid isomerase-like protein